MIEQLEKAYNVRLSFLARIWLLSKWGGKYNESERIKINSTGYSQAIRELIKSGIIRRSGVFPLSGYGESFEFTKPLFRDRKHLTLQDLSQIGKDIQNGLDEILK